MDPSSIPKKYGGKLEWTSGQPPHLDEETREALERDGNKGWVKGPALWLNNERVIVGTQNGTLRRSDQEIAEKKPIIYAADYTEQPVHPEKRRSTINSSNGSTKASENGTTVSNTDKARVESPSALNGPQAAEAGLGAAALPATVQGSQNKTASAALPDHIDPGTVRTSPVGDSQVRLPTEQAAAPSTTAEYISPAILPQDASKSAETITPSAAPETSTPVQTSIPTPAAIVQPVAKSAPHPPGHTQPGPLSQHTAELSRAIAANLQGESVVVIPEANGTLPHPDIISTSDVSKGLAIEAEKLSLSRPGPERFVTAMEIPQKS